MTWLEGQTIAAVASDCVLAATLLVFLFQAKSMREQVKHLARQTDHLARDEERSASATRAAVYQSLAGLMIDVDRVFLLRPELRCYFYEGAEEPADPIERSRVVALAETFIDLIDNFVAQAPHLPEHMSGPWDLYFKDLMRASPALRRFWNESRGWYSQELRDLLDPLASIRGPATEGDIANQRTAEVGDH